MVGPRSQPAGDRSRRCGAGPRSTEAAVIPIDLETVTEARLVSEALAGSQSAFEQIVRRFQRPMIGLIVRIVGDRGTAEDLAQEAFVRAFRNLAAFDTSRRLSSWLFRIAHNLAVDTLRRSRAHGVAPGAVEMPADHERDAPAAAPAPDPVERESLGRALEDALRRLRPAYRTAIVLRYEEGLSFEEIGQVLGIPETTARSHVHRARKELSALLTAEGWAPSR